MGRPGIVVGIVAAWVCALMAVSARADESVPTAVNTSAYDAESLRDPMKSLLPQPTAVQATSSQGQKVIAAPPPAPTPPKGALQGMVWGTGNPQAIIDGEVYRVGDMMKGAKIVAITPDGVTVETQGTSFVLKPATASPKAPRRTTTTIRYSETR